MDAIVTLLVVFTFLFAILIFIASIVNDDNDPFKTSLSVWIIVVLTILCFTCRIDDRYKKVEQQEQTEQK